MRVQARPVACADGNGRVEVVVEEIDGADPRMEVHGHARMRGVEIVQAAAAISSRMWAASRAAAYRRPWWTSPAASRRGCAQRTAQLGEVAAPTSVSLTERPSRRNSGTPS